MALNGAQLPDGMAFQPQNNKQAYLAYACGLLTDASALPTPRTKEEYLLREYCLNGGGGENIEIEDVQFFFCYDHRLEQYEELLPLFGTLTDIKNMFKGCNFTEFDIGALPVDNSGVGFNAVFEDCKKLVTLKRTGSDELRVHDFQNAFDSCEKLKNIDFKIVVMNAAEYNYNGYLRYAFGNCYEIEEISLEIDPIVTQNLDLANAFLNCRELKKCPIDFSKIKAHVSTLELSDAFSGCKKMAGTIDLCSIPLKTGSTSRAFKSCGELEGVLNIDLSNKATLSTEFFPNGTATAPAKLKRVTFTNGESGKAMGINLSYCSFEREAMVELFNTLPPPYAQTSYYYKITLTGNPCVTGTKTITGSTYEGTVAELEDFIADNHLSDIVCELNIDGQTMAVMGREIPGYFEGFPPEDIVTFDYPDAEVQVETLTDEDRAIAIAKGWTLVE